MKNFKMLCLDIDGTLLNSKHEITEVTMKLIKKVVDEKQVKVILVSARMPCGIDYLQRQLQIEAPIICYSGSLVLDKKYNVISNNYIGLNLVLEMIEEAKKENMHISLYKDNEWIIENRDEWARVESEITEIDPKVLNFKEIECTEKYKLGFNKVLIIENEEKIKKISDILTKKLGDKLNIYQSKPTYLEIMNKSVSKTSAIQQLMNLYNIEKDEVVSVGDNFNDIDMIKFAGIGVAMGNAPDEVKKNSDYVTLSNDEDGVANVIKKYFI
ncbi:Cof-type HAD-IIB family hydrolase [Clostridium butyricum]|uniref:Cof-type HAD-IIB family hydrolase n=1 Tax=Clostridium butyricum TaxID=1492 RepID=UPI003F92CB2D